MWCLEFLNYHFNRNLCCSSLVGGHQSFPPPRKQTNWIGLDFAIYGLIWTGGVFITLFFLHFYCDTLWINSRPPQTNQFIRWDMEIECWWSTILNCPCSSCPHIMPPTSREGKSNKNSRVMYIFGQKKLAPKKGRKMTQNSPKITQNCP